MSQNYQLYFHLMCIHQDYQLYFYLMCSVKINNFTFPEVQSQDYQLYFTWCAESSFQICRRGVPETAGRTQKCSRLTSARADLDHGSKTPTWRERFKKFWAIFDVTLRKKLQRPNKMNNIFLIESQNGGQVWYRTARGSPHKQFNFVLIHSPELLQNLNFNYSCQWQFLYFISRWLP